MCYKIQKKYILGSHTRPLKFISAPLKAKHFIGQLWQLMTASNVGARTQAWQAKWAVFKIPGFVCKRFLPFFPTLSPLLLTPFFAPSLTLVPGFLVLNRTETLATQANEQMNRQSSLTARVHSHGRYQPPKAFDICIRKGQTMTRSNLLFKLSLE